MARTCLTSLRMLCAFGLIAANLLPAARSAEEAEVVQADITRGQIQRAPTFRDRLLFGLQARLKSEVEFVDDVIEKVQEGELPRRMVDQTFFWARQHSGLKRGQKSHRPIIYFRPVMKARAKKIGVEL